MRDPDADKLVAFRMLALPFGAVRSVHGFLRIPTAYGAFCEFKNLCTCYFDDFIVLESSLESENIWGLCSTVVFKILS